jgi:peptidoglycan/xylan/chitin deacetylase (PgdA/CDA1 family)
MKRAILLLLILFLLNACSAAALPVQVGGKINPVLLQPAVATAQKITPKPSSTPIPTATPTQIAPTQTPLPAPTLVLAKQGPGRIICPILLYHHIAIPDHQSPYYVTPQEFRDQMQALKNWGYASITVTQLIKAINFGDDLPTRPVIITFDDGDASVFSQAFPVMQEFGFIGVNYLVVNYVGADGYMSVDQLKTLAASGWETGSHSMTHADLTLSKRVEWEVVQSRHSLEEKLGVPIETFAYPFGKKTAESLKFATENYRGAMGLGASLGQEPNNLFYLWRRPVMLGWDLQTFGSYLPWNAPPDG